MNSAIARMASRGAAVTAAAAAAIAVAGTAAQADVELYSWGNYSSQNGIKTFVCCDSDFNNNTFTDGTPLNDRVSSIRNQTSEARYFFVDPGYTSPGGWSYWIGAWGQVSFTQRDLVWDNVISSFRK